MRKRNESRDQLPNPRLKRKMLERWENEGGKVGEIDAVDPPEKRTNTAAVKQQPQTRKTN